MSGTESNAKVSQVISSFSIIEERKVAMEILTTIKESVTKGNLDSKYRKLYYFNVEEPFGESGFQFDVHLLLEKSARHIFRP